MLIRNRLSLLNTLVTVILLTLLVTTSCSTTTSNAPINPSPISSSSNQDTTITPPPTPPVQPTFATSLEQQPSVIITPSTQNMTPVQPAETKAKKYVGSKQSDKYHLPTCEWALKIKQSNEIWFSSAAEARAKHYEPCKVCKP